MFRKMSLIACVRSLKFHLNCSEIIRVIESLQLTQKYKVATPVDWKVGLRK